MDALLSDADLGLSYPAPPAAPAGNATSSDDLPAITVHRAGWTPAPKPAVDIGPVAQPVAAPPIGDAIPGSAPTPSAEFVPTAAPASPPAATPAGPKLFTDDDLGLAPVKDAGALTNAPDDSTVSGGLKGIATTAIKGLAHIPGTFGDAMDFGDYLIARGIAKVTGRPVEDILKEEAEATKKGGWTDPRNWLPSGPDISSPVLAKTGEYVPTSEPGKIAMAAGETALGGMVGGTGLTHLATNALAGTVGQGVTDVTQDPLLGAVAGIGAAHAAPRGVAAVQKVATPAVMGIPGIDRVPVVGPAVSAVRDNAAAAQVVGQASDPGALIQFAKTPVEPSLTPAAPQTLAGAVGNDRGLFQAEKDARNVNNIPFNEIDTAQSKAHQAAIAEAQPTGDVFRPGQVISSHLAAIDQAVQSAHENLAQRFQNDHAQATQAAQDAAAPLSELPTPEQTGAAIRTAQQEATNAAKQARDGLYKAVDPDGTLATVVTPLKQAKADIAAAIDPHTGVQPSGAEAKLWSDIDRLPDVVPFRSLQTLDSRVTAAMADARRNPSADDPQAISRLTQLKSAVMDAIHNGVENQAAHEARLVELGLLAPENALDGRLAGHLASYFERQQEAGLVKVSGAANGVAASGSSPASRVRRAEGSGNQGSGDDRRVSRATAPDGERAGEPQVGATLGAEAPALGDRTVSAQMHAPDTAAALGQDVPGTVVRPFSGPLDRQTNLPQGIVAYHGTPHDFDRFDLSKIGTGEGNQAYGHGLYFAENENVAKGYRDVLSARDADMRLGNQKLRRADLDPESQSTFDHIQEAGGNIDQAIAEAKQASTSSMLARNFERAEYWAKRAANLEDWRTKGFAIGGEGHSYQVRLNRDPDHFLDWDKPLSEQSPYVRSAIDGDPRFREAMQQHLSGVGRNIDPAAYNGGNLYAGMARNVGGRLDQASVTQAFRNAGIAGVRYLDAGSRGAGEGSRNYVAFNDRDIQVTHKNGVPLVRPVSLPDYLHGEASAAFSKELTDAGMTHAAFSPELQGRAGRLLADGKTLDHGKALEKAAYAEARNDGTLGSRAPGNGGQVSGSSESRAGSGAGVSNESFGLRQSGEAGGTPREDLRPNFDQAAADRLTAAKQSHIEYQQTYKNPTVKPILADNGFKGQYTLPNGAIPSRAIVAGDKGFETANRFLAAANNDPRAIAAMQDAALAPLRKAMPPIGNVHPNAMARWKEAYAGSLRALDAVAPGFSSRFDNAANATQAMLDLGVQQKAALQDFQRRAAAAAIERKTGAPGQFAAKVGGAIAPTEVENAVGSMMSTGTQGATRMRALVSSVSSDPDALAGLRKAGVDWMVRKFQNSHEEINGAQLISFVRNNKDTLKELFPTAQVSMFGAIADRIQADAAWRTSTAIKGGSDSAKNLLSHLSENQKAAAKHTSMLFVAYEAMSAGYEHGGITGAALGGAGATLPFLLHSLRSAGIKSVADLYQEALVNPETARLLISKMPAAPEGGKLRALAGALRRDLIVGAAQTQQAAH